LTGLAQNSEDGYYFALYFLSLLVYQFFVLKRPSLRQPFAEHFITIGRSASMVSKEIV
jgi:hypothetical protein